MKQPLLSIGMIFKNDIRCIERCLKSLTPLREAIPCELVMADTGSTDGSRKVAEQYADLLVDFPWVNDFAAARNAVMERCTGKWYLTIDTDEWLDEDFSQLVQFLRSEEADSCEEARVVQRNYMDRELEEYSDFFAARMGNREKGTLIYAAPIHEYLTYKDRPLGNRIGLPRVILHHDGYLELTPGAQKEKRKRNMVRLREELEKDPEDLRTLKHCMDSAESDAERLKYVRMARQVLADRKDADPFFSNVYDTCARFYLGKDSEALQDCLEEWHRRVPFSALYQVDGEYLYAALEYQEKQYEKALDHVRAYEEGIAAVDRGEDLRCPDRLSVMYSFEAPTFRQKMTYTRFHSLCKLGRFEEADALLKEPALLDMKPSAKGVLVLKALEYWPQLHQADAFLRAVWDRAASDLAEATAAKKYSACREWAKDLAAMFRQHYEKQGREVLYSFLGMEDRAPGLSARILLSEDPEEISRRWQGVKEWEDIFPDAYIHVMELGLPFPAGFYRQPSEKLAQLAAALAARPALPRAALDWLAHSDPPETPAELTWQLDLVTAALRSWKWKEEPEIGRRLCALYGELTALYLDTIYNPDLLTEEDLSVLPGMQRFGWYYGQALAAWEHDNELGYIRALRAGLKEAPAMRDMVEFLIEHKPKTAAQRQLEELAEQVRAVLARYPADDPAVAALKQSEVYQKVAHLMEPQQQAEPLPSLPPVSPAPLKEALAGSREEIAESVQKNIGRWGPKGEENRVGYWVKYPLWGKDREEVVENLSRALSEHRADFRWLFDRLADEQSRRILTAVLRCWRFYEIKELGAVKETRYDDYFDLDLLRCDENEVVADLGAYTGDTFLSYIKNYGSLSYRRYYAYEITKESFAQLQKAAAPYCRVVLRRKGAGDGPSVMTLDAGSNASSNALSAAEDKTAETVEVVALDDDIAEPLTLIKMDIEGAEQAALRGCARHIREDRPKLALSVYHNFEDLWKLPRMIEEYAPGYRFYLRYHGGNLWPSEITLLALPPQA